MHRAEHRCFVNKRNIAAYHPNQQTKEEAKDEKKIHKKSGIEAEKA
jgi:hypothetical protein